DFSAVGAALGARLRPAALRARGQPGRSPVLQGRARLRADVRRAAAQERHGRQGLHRRTAGRRRRRRAGRRHGRQRRLRAGRRAALPAPGPFM
ncbi:MAG: hypothetical protein AVDCRST_MAG65-1808, partial [uncultured Solirubrobacteraceae bacterium]